jgi:leader peptidase (prepilin peptidase)/N-methyltransferase
VTATLPPLLVVPVAALVGLCLGSFLSVVIHRGPRLWGLVDVPEPGVDAGPYDLSRPRSHCPGCRRRLGVVDLVPLLGFLRARGRCRACGMTISPLYPALELGMAAAAIIAVFLFATPLAMLGAITFFGFVIALSVIDARTGYLPDALTYPMTGVGLALSLGTVFVTPAAAIAGALGGFLAFFLIAEAYRALRGREGLGRGDAKFLMGAGAFMGPAALPPVTLVASIAALALVMAMRLTGRSIDGATEIRFGPFLGIGMVLVFIGQSFWRALPPAY